MSTVKEVGAYEAKTHLPELLRQVRRGQHYRITVRGEPVAELVPLGAAAKQEASQAVMEMQQLLRDTGQIPVPSGTLRNWVEEGRD